MGQCTNARLYQTRPRRSTAEQRTIFCTGAHGRWPIGTRLNQPANISAKCSKHEETPCGCDSKKASFFITETDSLSVPKDSPLTASKGILSRSINRFRYPDIPVSRYTAISTSNLPSLCIPNAVFP